MNLQQAIVFTIAKHNLDVMVAKRKYFEWLDGILDREDFDSFIDEAADRRRELGITEQDETEWQDAKKRVMEPLPF